MNDKYNNLIDEDVINLIKDGEQSAVDYLMEKYKNIVIQKARTLYLMGGDKDDLIQEGMIGLYKAIRDYKGDRDSSFYNFANLCVSRQIYSAIKASNRKKNMPLNTYISLNTPIFSNNVESEDKPSLVEIMSPNYNLNPEEMFIDKENTNMIEYELERRLSKLEKQVIKLYLDGMKYIQIAEVLGKEPKSIDNALQRIKAKLSELLKEI